ncbi:hypothetical protein [Levilinea saccharolytica]|uniref:Uncharacterized protein n=1 Tax=Levilinea saccharolytica TaxID=229921 RepID=A0A0P6XFP0_9CHLR|nr:hypothetical protein [Levilinea saccharolytica]KPL78471.1 hypothetical protein ADN01_14835 [Levilinea saccharolytica]GAP18495.1 hypothetical protein LSAC_02391 [Levilinea saccharolytica]
MVGNLILFAFCIFMAWLLYRFPLRKAKTPEAYRLLFLFFCVLTAMLLFNAFLAYLGLSGLNRASINAPTARLSDMKNMKSGDAILIAATVSERNTPLLGDYLAYTDENHLWSPMELWLDLKDESVAVTNDTYQASVWPIDAGGMAYLKAKQPVIVVGFVENTLNLVNGEWSQSVRADLIYAGTFEAFAKRAQEKQTLAMVMMAANLVAAVLLIILPVQECWKGMNSAKASLPPR